MAYSYITLAQAVTELTSRLYYGSNLWPSAELQAYILESIRTWGALTGFWRDEFSFNVVSGTQWYDIPALTGSLRPHSVTDLDVISGIEYSLMEPATITYPLAWSGSTQFTLTDILTAIERRQNESLALTRCNLTRSTVTASTSVAITSLADTILELIRVSWQPTTPGAYFNSILQQSDRHAERAYDPRYLAISSGVPKTWMQSSELPMSFSVDRVPPVAGSYELLYTASSTAPSTTAATALAVPDDWSWVVKFGAMMDLLGRDSNAQDQLRAQYCQARYREGLALLSSSPAVLAARIGTTPIALSAVSSGDSYNTLWQAIATGAPRKAYLAGLNLIAFSPLPNTTTSISLTVVRNAPIPANTAAYIQVSRDDLDSILDYAQHLAMFKLGGSEFLASILLYQNFYKRASLYNSRLKAMGQYQQQMSELSQLESTRNPEYTAPAQEVIGG